MNYISSLFSPNLKNLKLNLERQNFPSGSFFVPPSAEKKNNTNTLTATTPIPSLPPIQIPEQEATLPQEQENVIDEEEMEENYNEGPTVIEPIVSNVNNTSPKYGTIRFIGQNVMGKDLKHIFSFTLYLTEEKSEELLYNPKSRIENLYYFGLDSYRRLIQNPIQIPKIRSKNGQRFIDNQPCGMIIYTDETTLPFLMRAFPIKKNPNLTFAVVNWPYFSDRDGNINKNILRTMRFHAVQHFPTHNVYIRDADTLFTPWITEKIYDAEYQRRKKYYSFSNEESRFKSQAAAMEARRIAAEYFVQLMKNFQKTFVENLYNWENAYIKFVRQTKKQIILGTQDEYKADFHLNLPYPAEFTFPVSMHMGHVLNRPQPDRYLYLKYKNYQYPFYPYFKEKYMFRPHQAVYAGCVSVLENRSGITDFWKNCSDYLLQRIRRVTNKNILTNELIEPSYQVGKDERMLLYAVVNNYLDKIFFIRIPYTSEIKSKNYYFFQKNYFTRRNSKFSPTLANNSKKYMQHFFTQSNEHKAWLKKMLEQYPTEKEFSEALNKNIREKIIPYENLVIRNKEIYERIKNQPRYFDSPPPRLPLPNEPEGLYKHFTKNYVFVKSAEPSSASLPSTTTTTTTLKSNTEGGATRKRKMNHHSKTRSKRRF